MSSKNGRRINIFIFLSIPLAFDTFKSVVSEFLTVKKTKRVNIEDIYIFSTGKKTFGMHGSLLLSLLILCLE